MKKTSIFLGLLILSSALISESTAQSKIWRQNISRTDVNVRGGPVVVGQLTANVPTSGTIVVHFDGSCISSVGDRITLAASNTTSWGVNDGNVGVRAVSSDVNANSFSHTRSYAVSAGNHTFYAVAENYVETGGTGVASIYATLTVKFFSQTANQPFVSHQGIAQTSTNVRPAPVVVGQRQITTAQAGFVLVRFDGNCISDVGDRIVLAASDTPDWGVDDGNVGVEAVTADVDRNSFSHSRMYSVSAGTHTFYAVAHNYVETAGSGLASIYGSLTVEFYPNVSNNAFVRHQGIARTSNVRGGPTVVGQITINPPSAGTAFVHFDGSCITSVGDRIVLAASNTPNWGISDGNVGVEAPNSDNDARPFSHTRTYAVAAGSHTFYAVAENYVETAGTGIASIYASLTVAFYPDAPSAVSIDNAIPEAHRLGQNYPNPFNPTTTISFALPSRSFVTLTVFDVVGNEVASLVSEVLAAGTYSQQWNAANMPSGVYFYRLQAGSFVAAKKLVLIK